jgi:16S rRNA (cytosine967-C5)-methyltransferase
VLPEENDGAVKFLLSADFIALAAENVVAPDRLPGLMDAIHVTTSGLQMSPRRTGTDGFYVAILRKQ